MEAVNYSIREDGETLPLIITPKDSNTSVEFLEGWIKDNHDWLAEKMQEHGAVLFRGFGIENAADFEKVVRSYQPELSTEYRGTSPRRLQPGTTAVFSASELPHYYPIGQHIEMSFLPAPPRQLFFCCLEAPEGIGGETSLCDFHKVYRDLDPEVRKRFEDKGVMYVRNHTRHGRTLTIDPTMMKGWELMFDTSDKNIVEDECRNNNVDFNWYGKTNDNIQMIHKEEAIQYHPETNIPVWFNHTQVFSMPMVCKYMSYHCSRSKSLFFYFVYFFLSLMTWLGQLLIKPFDLGFTTMYGDGTPISSSDLNNLNATLQKNLVFNSWKRGDAIMIDNFRISHGRQPYTGKRKVVVSWSKPCPKPKAFSDRKQ
eukprot:m.4243 g.4243  ORF g.4243 m.4243 type:complete len:369 (+) comp10445_c0_seq1:53-1159(+)